MGCTNDLPIIHSQVYTAAKVAETLQVTVETETSLGTPLCEMHYKLMHRLLHTTGKDNKKQCYTCHCTIVGKARHCPNSTLVNEYFSECGDLDINIKEEDFFCTGCYNHHLDLVHKEQFISRDVELLELIKNTPAPVLETKKHGHIILAGLKNVTKQMGDVLLQRVAVLLPELYRRFVHLALQHADNKIADFQVTKQLPQAVFFGYITGFFGKHLVWECKVKTCGILLYRRGADLAFTLSKALRCLQKNGLSFLKRTSVIPAQLGSDEALEEQLGSDEALEEEEELTRVLSRLNERIHNQIETITTEDAKSPFDISTFNLEACIRNVDPVLWKMVAMLTRSLTETQRNTAPTCISHRRKVRCFYTLCVMLFNTNRSCSMPMHVLLTDLVDAQGGSIELIRTLNRLGAIACADTQQRYVQFVVEKQLREGLVLELDKKVFWAVTVDNLDFLKPHAFVFSGDQTRSIHCTTVQGNQFLVGSPDSDTGSETPLPLPSTSTSHESSTLMNEDIVSSIEVTDQELAESSPTTKSPAFKKVRRRSRTSKETKSTHHFIPSSPNLKDFTPAIHPLQQISHNHYSSLKNRSVSDFMISKTEEKELNNFKAASFLYMLQNSTSNKTLPFLTFLEKIFPHKPLPSKYVYMDVLNQNADSQETIGDVVSRLHKEFGIGDTLQHLVVAGDAKTFVHLQNLKFDYGEELSWLIPFPGDFHVLKNFQPILQKTYFDAGLKQMASACGYRAETLTSLQNSSHFKRTHHYFMQAWEAMYLLMVEAFTTANSELAQSVKELNESVKY